MLTPFLISVFIAIVSKGENTDELRSPWRGTPTIMSTGYAMISPSEYLDTSMITRRLSIDSVSDCAQWCDSGDNCQLFIFNATHKICDIAPMRRCQAPAIHLLNDSDIIYGEMYEKTADIVVGDNEHNATTVIVDDCG